MNRPDGRGSLLDRESTDGDDDSTPRNDGSEAPSPSAESTRADRYRDVPDGIPRFVVRRLSEETLERITEGDRLTWTKR